MRYERDATGEQMKPLFNLHTHTIAGGHAYSTLKENVDAAKERSLAALCISGHAPPCPAPPTPFTLETSK